jgi:hypothetical protein
MRARAAAGFEARGWAVSLAALLASSVFIGECSLAILALRFSTTSITSALSHSPTTEPLIPSIVDLMLARAALFLCSLVFAGRLGADGKELGAEQQGPEHATGVDTEGLRTLPSASGATWERALIFALSCARSSARRAALRASPSDASTSSACMSVHLCRLHEAPGPLLHTGEPPPSSGGGRRVLLSRRAPSAGTKCVEHLGLSFTT